MSVGPSFVVWSQLKAELVYRSGGYRRPSNSGSKLRQQSSS